MTISPRVWTAVELWPEGAPRAAGDGPEDRPRLTPYRPGGAGEEPVAAVVVCPGGGYAHRAPHECEPVARWLCSLGVAALVLDYRVAPYRHPVPLGDAQRAVRVARHRAGEWGLDAGRVGILGFSAGGHLAASAGTIFDSGDPAAGDPVERLSCRPDALMLAYPVITFGEHRHAGSMDNLLGPDADAALRREMSLENRVTPGMPPTFLWHAADDAAVPVHNSLLFAAALRRAGVPFEMHVFPQAGHGPGLNVQDTSARAWPRLCADWLARIGFRSA